LKNDSEALEDADINAVLLDKNGCEVGNASALANILPNEECSVNMKVGCDNITLWNGTKAPYLYTCKITVRSGKYIDTVTEKTGFRTFSLDSGTGIILNGRRVFLKGVNYHQDSFENGWAMNDKQRQRDYGMIADMGANAVRMAHYQHDKAEYDLCDDLGLAVWSEIPLINHTFTGDDKIPHPKLEENLLCQLTEMIRQNYNHPSVLFWGISNELYDTDNVTAEIYKKLVHKARAEDGTRVIIYADNVASVDTRSRSAAADAVGYNRYDGWYYSCLGGMSEWINEKYAVDNRPTCISEYGGAGAISQHMEQPEQTDIDPNGLRHFEEYLSILHEKTWENIFSMDNIFGAFIWCMFDFPSAGRIEGDTKGQNDKGLATRERVPKDVYYFYKSLWSGEPVVHITSKRFYRRTAVIPEVKIYSNAASVRVFVNGEFIGDAERKGNVFILKNVRLKTEQDNHIRAEAVFYDGIILSDECLWIGQ
jgi:beta-galactosidase